MPIKGTLDSDVLMVLACLCIGVAVLFDFHSLVKEETSKGKDTVKYFLFAIGLGVIVYVFLTGKG